MTLAIVISLWVTGAALAVIGMWYGLFGRRQQIEESNKPIGERVDGSPYPLAEVVAALMRWRDVYEEIALDGEKSERLDRFLGIVLIEFRAKPWDVGLSKRASGQVLNPDAAARGHAAPRIAVAVRESIYQTALGHELTDAWHLWAGAFFVEDPDRPHLGSHVDAALEAMIETRWRQGA